MTRLGCEIKDLTSCHTLPARWHNCNTVSYYYTHLYALGSVFVDRFRVRHSVALSEQVFDKGVFPQTSVNGVVFYNVTWHIYTEMQMW